MAKVNIVDRVKAMENEDKVKELISKQVRLPATIVSGSKLKHIAVCAAGFAIEGLRICINTAGTQVPIVMEWTYNEWLFRFGVDLTGKRIGDIHNIQRFFELFFGNRFWFFLSAYMHLNSSFSFQMFVLQL